MAVKNYIDPCNVRSPQKRISGDIDVLYDTGENGWSFARFYWDNKKMVGPKNFGIRWNGNDDWIGYPSTCQKPTWYVLPPGAGELLMKALGIEDKTVSTDGNERRS